MILQRVWHWFNQVCVRRLFTGLLCTMLAACASQGAVPNTAASAARLMVCDRGTIVAISVAADGSSQWQKRLTLSKDQTCPQWSPDGTGAVIASTQEIISPQNTGRSIFHTQLQWYDASSAYVAPLHRLRDEDGLVVPIWRDEFAPQIVTISTRNNGVGCLPYVYSQMEKIQCRNTFGALYRLEAEGEATLLVDHVDKRPFCWVDPSPDGFWLSVVQGTCAGASHDNQITLFDLNSDEMHTVPISSALHSVISVLWHPTQRRVLIRARYLGTRGSWSDLLVYSLDTGRLTTWANGLRDLQFAAWRGDDVLFVDGDHLLVARERESNSYLLSRLPSTVVRCAAFFALSRNGQTLVRRDRCDRSYSIVQWVDTNNGNLHTAKMNYSATGNIAVSPDGQWIAVIAWLRGLPGPSVLVGKLLLINTRTNSMTEAGDVSVNTRLNWY